MNETARRGSFRAHASEFPQSITIILDRRERWTIAEALLDWRRGEAPDVLTPAERIELATALLDGLTP